MRTQAEVIEAFTYHPPASEAEKMFYERFRNTMKDCALFLIEILPECPERTIAIRHIEQAVMYANATVARKGLALPPDGMARLPEL